VNESGEEKLPASAAPRDGREIHGRFSEKSFLTTSRRGFLRNNGWERRRVSAVAKLGHRIKKLALYVVFVIVGP
jgi:hypothetical protein